MDEGRRVCVYHGTRGLLSTTDPVVVVPAGAGAACPLTPPAPRDEALPPPTAALVSQDVSAQGRACIYAQLDGRWSIAVPLAQQCPPAAGMLKQDDRRGASR